MNVKHVSGTISGVNRMGISVEYEKSETSAKEMYLPFQMPMRYSGLTDVKELHPGDAVEVEYKEVTTTDKVSHETQVRRVATAVILMGHAAAPLPPTAEPEASP